MKWQPTPHKFSKRNKKQYEREGTWRKFCYQLCNASRQWRRKADSHRYTYICKYIINYTSCMCILLLYAYVHSCSYNFYMDSWIIMDIFKRNKWKCIFCLGPRICSHCRVRNSSQATVRPIKLMAVIRIRKASPEPVKCLIDCVYS